MFITFPIALIRVVALAQTASVGVSTTRFVRNEGEVIRHNFLWCLVILCYLIVISVACYLFFPGIAKI